MNDFDVVVLGVGCAGAAVCSELSRRGLDVLGVERFGIVNEFGSSHGDVRLFRFAYQEGSEYVPFLIESADRWRELESFVDGRVFDPIGSATMGFEDSGKLASSRDTCDEWNIGYEMFSGDVFSEEFGMWSLPPEVDVLYQDESGLLYSRRGVEALVAEARGAGAVIRTQTEVASWEDGGDGVVVELDDEESVSADALVVTAGPWASEIGELSDLLTVERHVVGFLDVDSPLFDPTNAPVWVFDGGEDEQFYGSPSVDGEVKLGNLGSDYESSISGFNREWEVHELLPEVRFARSYFSSTPSSIRGEVCPITNSPDGDFIIDSSDEFDNVYYGVGLSGHGMKLAPSIGRLIADCVVEGEVEPMFSLDRF